MEEQRLEKMELSDEDEHEGHHDNSELDGVFPIPNYGTDVADIPDSKAIVSLWDIFLIVFSICTHIVDLAADINLSHEYYRSENYTYFLWSTGFMLLPSFINIIVSIRMYQQDYEQSPDTGKRPTLTNRAVQQKLLCPFILVLQLAPVLRYCDCLSYAVRSFKCRKTGDTVGQKKYYGKMLKEEQDISLLRVFECFLEAAPHLVLQITLMLIDYNDDRKFSFQVVHQIFSIGSSLVSMGWAMSSYHRNIRLAQRDKKNISNVGYWIQFLWHFFVTVSRIASICAAAAIFSIYTIIVCFVHWFIMTTWVLTKPTGMKIFCRDQRRAPHLPDKIHEKIGVWLFSAVFGVVYVFTYLKPAEGSTFYRHIFYYGVCAVENTIACLVWALVDYNLVHLWYFEFIICLCTVPFVLGIVCMIIYYKYFHPTLTRVANSTSETI